MESAMRFLKSIQTMKLIRYQTPDVAAWTPFDRLSSLRDLLDSAFQLAGSGGSTGWSPALDVYEDEEKLTVLVEAAGMRKDDFSIALHDGVLTVSGERKSESQDGESFRSERVFGSFSRSISLPAPVKADGVTATYRDGILTVTLPKAEEAKPRKIEVKLN
jgi:HSP20 family protein